MDADGCKRPSGLSVGEEELSCSPLEERRGTGTAVSAWVCTDLGTEVRWTLAYFFA